jgi:hypothetical protein
VLLYVNNAPPPTCIDPPCGFKYRVLAVYVPEVVVPVPAWTAARVNNKLLVPEAMLPTTTDCVVKGFNSLLVQSPVRVILILGALSVLVLALYFKLALEVTPSVPTIYKIL